MICDFQSTFQLIIITIIDNCSIVLFNAVILLKVHQNFVQISIDWNSRQIKKKSRRRRKDCVEEIANKMQEDKWHLDEICGYLTNENGFVSG
jgi:hypothetical protein